MLPVGPAPGPLSIGEAGRPASLTGGGHAGSAAESRAASIPGVAPPSLLERPSDVPPSDATSPLLPEPNEMPAEPGAPAELTEEVPAEALEDTPEEPEAAVA